MSAWWLLLIVPASWWCGRWSAIFRGGGWIDGYVRGWKDRATADQIAAAEAEKPGTTTGRTWVRS